MTGHGRRHGPNGPFRTGVRPYRCNPSFDKMASRNTRRDKECSRPARQPQGEESVDLPAAWTTADGSALTLRRLDESDAEGLIAFVRDLSVTARYFRFGQGDYDPGLDQTLRSCRLCDDEGTHLVALASADHGARVVGSARYVIQPGRSSCEFAIVVADAWNHHGVGHRLMDALLDRARAQGLQKMVGRILASNRDMLQFVRGFGFEISDSTEGDWMKIASLEL